MTFAGYIYLLIFVLLWWTLHRAIAAHMPPVRKEGWVRILRISIPLVLWVVMLYRDMVEGSGWKVASAVMAVVIAYMTFSLLVGLAHSPTPLIRVVIPVLFFEPSVFAIVCAFHGRRSAEGVHEGV